MLNKSNHLVSICIPLYNCKNFIKETINSVLDQDYRPIEIIIIDNNSNDGSEILIKEICKSLENEPCLTVRLYTNKETIPSGANWNLALSLATGKYIKLLHSDDIIFQHCLSKQVAILNERSEIAFTSSAKVIINKNSKKIIKGPSLATGIYGGKEFANKLLLHGCGINKIGEGPGILLRSADILGISYVVEGSFFMDIDYILQICCKDKYFYHMNEVLYGYRIHEGSGTSSYNGKINRVVKDYKILLNNYRKRLDLNMSAKKEIFLINY